MNMLWKEIRRWLNDHESAMVSDEVNTYHFPELAEIAAAHGERLKDAVRPGMKCAILCERGIHTAIALLTCWGLDLIPIPLSLHYGEQHSRNILALTEPEVLITDGACDYPAAIKYNMNNSAMDCAPAIREIDDDLQDVALILCTSGTTGKPKGVMLTAEGLLFNVRAIGQYFAVGKEDTILIARPLFHSAVLTGEFLLSLYKGVNIVFCDQKYSPVSVVGYVEQKDITVLCGTPTLLNHIAFYAERYKKQLKLKTIALSGEGLPENTARSIRKAFPETSIYHVYGLTEASPRVSYLPPQCFDQYPNSAGIPLEGIDIRIVDAQNLPVLTGEHGRITVKTPGVMKGYYRNPDETRKRLQNGWLFTGDMGYISEEGYLYVVSREDDMIIKGGMNIYPREIEEPVSALYQVKECIAYGVPTDNGITIGIDLVPVPEWAFLKKKEWMQLLMAALPEYLLPAQLNIVDAVARTASGKRIRKA